MAFSKHAHLRYNLLDYCFRNKAYTFEELLHYLNQNIAETYPGEGISTRTLRSDLKVFRDKENGFGAPLPEKSRILKYSNPNFSIAQRPLLLEEQQSLLAAQQLLERFENHPKYNKLAEALITFQESEEQHSEATQILFYDHNEEYKGIQHLKPLYLAIKKQQVLHVTYQGFHNSDIKQFHFHPYILKQYNRRWFVFGRNSNANIATWSIPLDERLIKFNPVENEKYLPSTTNWNNYFRTMVGIRRGTNEPEIIVLKFYNGREKYFKTKPFIPDYEEFFEIEKQDQVWFNSIINPELIQQILSYGADVEVIAPLSLKQAIATQVQQLQQLYVS